MKKRGIARIIIIIIAALFFLILFNFLASSSIFESQPDSTAGKDTYIRENSDNNYASSGIIEIGKTAGGVELRGLLEFNLTNISASNTITNAIISLYLTSSSNNNNMTLKAHRITSFWNASAATWNNRTNTSLWSTAGGDYSSNFVSINITNQSTWYNFTITDIARGWINGTYSNYGVILLSEGASNGDYKDFNSSESAEAIYRPRIIVEYTANALPSIISISTNSSLSSPKEIGENITFTINWSDLEGDSTKLLICNSTNISINYGCGDKTFCNTSYSASSPLTCQYTISSSENRTNNFYVSVCDSNCSEANLSYFYMNHAPSIKIIQPNGGETINQTQGNYLIKFNVSDIDKDNLTASIYYGTESGSVQYIINTSLNISNYCTDDDSNLATQNNCSYSWNSSGVYGTYYLTIKINDSYILSSNSSASNFSVISVIDTNPPNVTSQWIESGIYSGKIIQIYANISDENALDSWASLNTTPQQNITMNLTGLIYNATFTAPQVGTYKFKVYARDILGNLNDSSEWQEFNVSKPQASHQNQSNPSTALPMHLIMVTSQFNATNSLRDVFAYLNTPEGFIFLSDYPQNSSLGNFTSNQTKTAYWVLSTPSAEATYTLNISYNDYYSNSWNSSNFQISTSSAIGGYSLEVSGYPEVETTDNYYAEASFTQNGNYISPDSITIKIYDSLGNLIVGPASMDVKQAGIYNYSYTVGASAAEGQWETRVNATKSSSSYLSSHFWKVVGGPFDVRDITIGDSVVNDLQISVTTENTGGAAKDLTLEWNLTRTDNNAVLDSGSDTFAVSAYSTRTWTITPSTSYVGEVKITFLGHYSGTEKAGAYETFTTTSGTSTPITPQGGGGGGGSGIPSTKTNLSLTFDREISLTKNIEKTISFELENTGDKTLNNITLKIYGINESYYSITPESIESLKTGRKASFDIKFFISDFSGEQDFYYLVSSKELTRKEYAKIIVMSMKDYFYNESLRLENLLNEKSQADAGELEKCREMLDILKQDIKEENFINAKEDLSNAEECITNLEIKKEEKEGLKIDFSGIFGKIEGYWGWIITWGLIVILIIVLVIIIYIVYRKLKIINILKAEPIAESNKKMMKKEYFDNKIKDIERKLGDNTQEEKTEL